MELKLHKVYPNEIDDYDELKEAVADFGLNLAKAKGRLKNDKEIVLEALKSDPFAVTYLSAKLKEDADIRRLINERNSYLNKYLDPLLYKEEEKAISDYSENDISRLIIRNERAFDIEQQLRLMEEPKGKDSLAI